MSLLRRDFMKLFMNNEVYTYENTNDQVNEMFDMINKEAERLNVHISHLMIDDNPIYENHGDYIVENLQSVQRIEVVMRTNLELINDGLVSMESYLQGALPEIDPLIDEFYQNPTEETWHKLDQLLEGIEWLAGMIQIIDRYEKKLENWDDYLKVFASFENELNELMNAMENRDNVLIADIIQYEITPLMTDLKTHVSATLDEQGEREDLS